jgi:hypothetical protein
MTEKSINNAAGFPWLAHIAHTLPAAVYPLAGYGSADDLSGAIRPMTDRHRSSPSQGNSFKTHVGTPLMGMLMGSFSVFGVIVVMGPVLPAHTMAVRSRAGLVVMGMLVPVQVLVVVNVPVLMTVGQLLVLAAMVGVLMAVGMFMGMGMHMAMLTVFLHCRTSFGGNSSH